MVGKNFGGGGSIFSLHSNDSNLNETCLANANLCLREHSRIKQWSQFWAAESFLVAHLVLNILSLGVAIEVD